MNSLSNPQDNPANTIAATKRLARAIAVANGEFSLILACCNSVKKQQQILTSLKQSASVNIQEIMLLPTDETLYTTITTTLGTHHPEALMIMGLESVAAINQLITSANIMRDEFRKTFHCPLVLWVNEEILQKLVWLAPDLKNWAANTIKFDVPNPQFVENTVLSA
ncbi:hypothetical protein Nos7524_2083 [Nostoc sp. PCC 7524]|uniref:hypothetical protein n=1 Tax=Nostoc sp. (strain ATCC 29411 / PCC 7524) TaxID=28072 RepID=UPI00029EF920|nr:hypothetical protein [Nostoc sp. PCC 7524]AFY47935.1 hypothetical protein Nos7524_2083 [Nostoc sp. PCC 7524]